MVEDSLVDDEVDDEDQKVGNFYFLICMMSYFNSSKSTSNKWFVIFLILLSFFLLIREIYDSGYLVCVIVIAVLLVVVWFIHRIVEKKLRSRPALLWNSFKKKYPIIPQYTPPKWINPAEAWLLYNLKVEPTDLTSLIYQWKFENLIDIKTFKWENSDKEYVKLIKKDDIPLARPLFETGIFDSIFSVWDVKIIEWAFQLRYALMLEDLEYHCIQKWWVEMKWNKNKKDVLINLGKSDFWIDEYWNQIWFEVLLLWMFLFFVVLFIIMESLWVYANVFMSFSNFMWSIGVLLLLIFWGIFYYWFKDWWWKLKFTDAWAELASQVIGYSEFIKSCDQNKIKLLLKEDPLFIDRTLPYATAFWMETEFLKKISPLKKDWNARYFRWTKVPTWVWVLRFLVKDDNSFF